DAVEVVRRRTQLLGFLPVGDVPDAQVPIEPDRVQGSAVGREYQSRDRLRLLELRIQGVGLEGLDLLHAGHVPELDHAVGATGGQELAVRAEGDGVDRVAVRAQVLDFLAVGGVPQPHRLVGTARGQQLAVRAEGDAVYDAGVPLELAHYFAVRDVP